MSGPPPPPYNSGFDNYFRLRLPIMGPSHCLEATSSTWAAGRNYVRLDSACTSATPANSWAATRWFNNGTTYTQAGRGHALEQRSSASHGRPRAAGAT